MDISMPVMDGMTATRKIREFECKHSLPRTPIYALTGLASATARNEALEAGVDQFLTKPISFPQLAQIVFQTSPPTTPFSP
jgi:CheY-like chemotaxis protein